MKITAKGAIKYILLLCLGAALLYFAFRNIDWKDFSANLKKCNFVWVAAMFLLCWLINFLRGCRWRLLILPFSPGVSRLEAYDGYAICYLSNLALPRSGEVIRCGVLSGRGHGTFEQVLGTVVLERTWDIVCMFLVAVPLLFIGRFQEFLAEKLWQPTASSLAEGGLSLILPLAAAILVIVALSCLLRKRTARTRVGKWMAKVWKGLTDGIRAGFRMKDKWAFFGYSALIWLGHLGTSYMTIRAFDALSYMNVSDALLLLVVGSLGWLVPVPGGFGVYHSLLTITLMLFYGMSQSDSLLLATVSHETQVLQMFVCGIISLIHLAMAGRGKKKTPTI